MIELPQRSLDKRRLAVAARSIPIILALIRVEAALLLDRQLASQPSPFTVFPSSQRSYCERGDHRRRPLFDIDHCSHPAVGSHHRTLSHLRTAVATGGWPPAALGRARRRYRSR